MMNTRFFSIYLIVRVCSEAEGLGLTANPSSLPRDPPVGYEPSILKLNCTAQGTLDIKNIFFLKITYLDASTPQTQAKEIKKVSAGNRVEEESTRAAYLSPDHPEESYLFAELELGVCEGSGEYVCQMEYVDVHGVVKTANPPASVTVGFSSKACVTRHLRLPQVLKCRIVVFFYSTSPVFAAAENNSSN
ncbi:hypothetical protein V1264_015548 [Littorina saxatilis]|uniref:Uncharacterized protein n=1 Tax=Littorina saxatilis TaxID=31220 RepID=A0AAN9BL98_9CAEN